MSVTKPRMRGGFALVEALVGAAILGFTLAAFFRGVSFFSWRARENSERLTAEAIAWDAVWKTFNEPLANLQAVNLPAQAERRYVQNLNEDEAAQLCAYDMPPQLTLRVVPMNANEAKAELADTWWSTDLVRISADLEWGNRSRRWRLSELVDEPVAYRGGTRRAYPR